MTENNAAVKKNNKVPDFLIGFFLVGGVFDFAVGFAAKRIDPSLLTSLAAGAALAGLALSVYLYQTRKYMGIGLASALGLHLVAVLPYMLIMMAR